MRVHLNNHMLLGDTLMMTPAVRDIKRAEPDWQIRVDTNHMAVWDNNPHLTPFSGKPDMSLDLGPKIVTQGSATNGLHFTTAFRVCLEHKLNRQIQQGQLRPELFLSDGEKAKRFVDGNYWVVCTDTGPYKAKLWVNERWQEMVDRLSWITWVQIGLSNRNEIRLSGPNVIDMLDQTNNLRDLFVLMYHADGFAGLVSGPMHVAAAFSKPAVIIGGAREPATFERYAWHRYLDTIGCLPCAKDKTCWCCGGCKANNLGPSGRPKCIDMITTDHAVDAVESYYVGGRLEKPAAPAVISKPKLLRIVSNGRVYGGAERSVVEIAKIALADGWNVELATRGGILCKPMREALPPEVGRTHKITDPCDVLLLYASDMIWDFGKPEFEPFGQLQADRRVMALTYKIGRAGVAEWSKGWDKYLFLSSTMRNQFGQGEVLAPPVDLSTFFAVKPDRVADLHLVRHSSQGDKKYPKDIGWVVASCPNARFSFMPAPTFLNGSENVDKLRENEISVPEFLSRGNCFFYLLPENYTDQGPRAIMEAMAAGLPVIAENRDGARDRVMDECGWLVDSHKEAVEIIRSLDAETLQRKGQAARQRAKEHFRKELWWKAIVG